MTRLHRDAPAELAAPPRFTTHGPPAVTWRSDLIQVVIAAGAVLGFGAFLVISLAVLLRSWTVLGVGLWLTGLGSLTPFLILAYMIIRELSDRHMLNRTRVWAESQMLTGWLDMDMDGQLEDDELARFIRYVAALYRGEPTTASHAATRHKISAGTWQSWRNAIISLGLATEVDKRGGPGFELLDSIRRTSWDAIEEHIRKNAPLSVRKGTSPGVLITQDQQPKLPRTRPPVTTLPGDLYDEGNVDGD